MIEHLLNCDDYRGVHYICHDCGGDVADYLCNEALIALRPQAKDYDYWMLCLNPLCKNHQGEDWLYYPPEWATWKYYSK